MKFLLLFTCLPLCAIALSLPEASPKQLEEEDERPPYLQHNLDLDGPTPLNRRVKRQMPKTAQMWPNSTVQFFFDPYMKISQRNKDSVLKAQKYIQSRTCVNFVENANFDPVKINLRNAPNIISVYKGKRCASDLGMRGGIQGLSLGEGCELMGVVAHEFIHALGVLHEQQRSDRDNYVTVDTSAVQDGYVGTNFDKSPAGGDYINTPYDYGSVMHYGADYFVKQPGTLSIIPKDKRYTYTIGNRLISFYDIQKINAFYGCDAKCTATNSAKCMNGGVPNPRNCAECNCPRGYGGPLCDQRPAGCGSTLKATSEWQRESTKTGTYGAGSVLDVYTECNTWITAPAGKQVELKFLFVSDLNCDYGCGATGVEVKTDADTRISNPLRCCQQDFREVIKSPLNPAPVISYSRNTYSSAIFEYRYVDGPVKPTTTTTTKRPPPPRNCRDTLDYCQQLWGYCSSASFSTAKANCAKTCGLCGKTASPCVDSPKCPALMANGGCTSVDPMKAESECAQTCGYCEYPN